MTWKACCMISLLAASLKCIFTGPSSRFANSIGSTTLDSRTKKTNIRIFLGKDQGKTLTLPEAPLSSILKKTLSSLSTKDKGRKMIASLLERAPSIRLMKALRTQNRTLINGTYQTTTENSTSSTSKRNSNS